MPRPSRTSPRAGRARCAGFTLVEVLTALVLIGMLMAVIGGVMSQMVDSSAMLEERLPVSERYLALRRLLHRDLVNCLDGSSFRITAKGFAFESSNSHLRGVPLTMLVSWNFDMGRVVRTESSLRLDYDKTLVVMPDVPHYTVEYYINDRKAWVGQGTAYSLSRGADKQVITGLRLTLRSADGDEVRIIEKVQDV